MNLLQSAGFSRSNPYYIVPQGRITALCNARDADRLALLKEVAGTRVYEEHRAESIKIMEETARKRERIGDLLLMIGDRLSELEEEKLELEEALSLEREKKACEYTVWSRKAAQINASLDALETEEGPAEAGQHLELQLQQLQQIEVDLLEQKSALEELQREEALHQADLQELIKESAAVHIEPALHSDTSAIEHKLAEATAQLAQHQSGLAGCSSDLQALTEHEDQIKQKIHELQAERSILAQKSTRSNQFRTPGERDKWIKQECLGLRSTVELSKRQLATLVEEEKAAGARLADLEAQLAAQTASNQESMAKASMARLALKQVQSKRDEVVEARRDGWRAEARLEGTLRTIREEIDRCQRGIGGMVDRGTFAGLLAVGELARSLDLADKVYGPLADLFTADPVYQQAVEAVAGGALFHVVVEDEDTAIAMMEAMVKEKCGRITFVPRQASREALSFQHDDGFMLIDKLRFDTDRFTAIMHRVFASAFVTVDLCNEASRMARLAGLDIVTLAGDRQSRRGPMVGGYSDVKRCKLSVWWRLKEWRDKEAECVRQLSGLRQKLSSLDHSLCQLTSQAHVLERSNAAEVDLSGVERERSGAGEICRLKARVRMGIEGRIDVLQERIDSLTAELGRPFAPVDKSTIDTLARELEALGSSLDQTSQAKAELCERSAAIQNAMIQCKSERSKWLADLAQISSHAASHAAASKLSLGIQQAQGRLGELGVSMDELRAHIAALSLSLDQGRCMLAKAVPADGKLEKYLSKRSHLLQDREEVLAKVRGLGVVSEDLVAKYAGLRSEDILGTIHSLAAALRTRYPHVNRRARDQHVHSLRQSEELLQRQAELDASAAAIREFVGTLDAKKEEAILRTFGQVGDAFKSVFEELGGCGELELVRDDRLDFAGIAVSIKSFGLEARDQAPQENSENACPQLHSNQLSGGQKSLVALALILAIQRVDPAPFYLFDEVDAALDSAHRHSLASIVAKMSRQAQFIITTFREELVGAADCCWGVVGGGASGSSVEAISRDVALQFIEHQGS